LLLGVAGACAFLVSGLRRRNAVLVFLLLCEAIWSLYEVKITPIHFWTARRWIVLTIPCFLFFGSYAIVYLADRMRWRLPESFVPFALALVLIPQNLSANLPFANHVEFAGSTEQVAALAESLPENAVLFFDDDPFGIRMSAPLHYLWDRTTVMAWNYRAGSPSLAAAAEYFGKQGRPIYWIRGSYIPGTPAPPEELDLPVGHGQSRYRAVLDVPEAVVTWDTRPSQIGRLTVPYVAYEIEPIR
jgi:hypothetical protein